jgi:hypothetical protein
MTDSHSLDDELVSRVLDGEATTDERARVATDPALQRRLQAFVRARAALVDVEPAPTSARDDAIAAAVQTATVAATVPVATIAAAHARTRRRRVVAAVGVAATLVIGVPLLAIALSGRGAQQRSASETAAEAPTGASADTVAPSTNGGAVSDLGVIDSDAQLLVAVQGALGSAQATPRAQESSSAGDATGSSAPDSGSARAIDCPDAQLTRDPSLGSVVWVATATWQSEPAIVAVYRAATDVIVVMRDDCTVVARIPT